MVARYIGLLGLALSLFVVTSCQGPAGGGWSRSRTKGLGGRHYQRSDICSVDEFYGDEEEEFIPFADSDLYHGIMRGDELALVQIDADTPIPQSRIVPGEKGSALPGIDGFRDPSSLKEKGIFQNVHFVTDDYVIRGSENLQTVQQVAAYLRAHPGTYVFVEGHCDERGSAAYNLALGTRRANAVRNSLVKEGISPDRLLTVSYGKERPIALNHDPTSWKENRRSQFKLFAQN